MGVFIDFQSAFDMMWRAGLLIKLKNLGITGNIFNFIKNFLTDRSIQVKVGSTFSQKYTLDNGAAQGSIISPLLSQCSTLVRNTVVRAIVQAYGKW